MENRQIFKNLLMDYGFLFGFVYHSEACQMKSEEVAVMLGCNPSTARNWAAKNGVGRKMVLGILAYDWTEADIERFKQRPHAGRPRKK